MPFKFARTHSHQGNRGRRLHTIYPALVTPILIAALIVAVLSFQVFKFPNFSHAASLGRPVTLAGTISPLLAISHLRGPADAGQRIYLSIGLRPNNEAELTKYVQDISRPGSVNYHRFLSMAQFTKVFSPGVQAYNTLRQFLETSGFTITHTYNHRLLIAFSGTIGQAEQAFQVNINNYSTPNGQMYYANSQGPVMPSMLADLVLSISGLNNATNWHHPPLPIHHNAIERRGLTHYDSSCPGHQSGYLTPDQVAAAYNLNDLYNAHYHGEGQTVALFELDTFPIADLLHYASCYGHNHTTIQTIVTGTGRVPTDGGVQEVELDSELVLSAAPQLGVLKIYEAANDTADYNAEWAQIIQDAPPVVSTSWGNCEKAMDPQEVQQENVFFAAAATQGESIFAASGDSGSAGCAFNLPPSNVLNAGDPGTQPFVTSVGGTSLQLNGSSYGSEQTWNNQYGASGGGISQYWSAPLWQNTPGVNNNFSSRVQCSAPQGSICRETPDVSLNADPNNGYLVYCSSMAAGCSASGNWYIIGGTSAAAPMWAAMMALTNEMSLRTGGFNIGFVNPLLYQAANNPGIYASSFHDVTAGTNDFSNLNNGSYPASANYDMATGLGSYNAYTLATQLVALSQHDNGMRTAPANTTWYFAEGSVGGGFQEILTLLNPSATQDATVNITYLFETKPALTVTHTVPQSSRVTVNVNGDVNVQPFAGHLSVAAIVKVISGPGIVAERPMYFNFQGIQSGTDVMGTTTPGTSYYFPMVDTRQIGRSYYTYISILNPGTTQSATTKLTFYTGSCGLTGQPSCPTQTVITPPLHRGTGSPLFISLYQQTAMSVQSNIPVVVERPMYFRDTIPTTGGLTTGAASEIGAKSPANDWLFAEGYTGNLFQEYLVLANFSATATTANIELEYNTAHTQTVTVTVPALGHIYFDVNQANAHPTGSCDTNPCVTTNSAATEIISSAPIVAERLMYFKQGPGGFSGATDTVGEIGPAAHSVYVFSEGYTGGTFEEYLTLQNPTHTAETVAVTLFVGSNIVMQQQVTIKAHSRFTFSINAIINPIAQGQVSMTVQALGAGAKIVAERPMYFDRSGQTGGTNVLGYTGG